ncbi:HAD superfamily hydrolase (TIGR01509 family) [Haloferula luteola]|uniref:HAD superfamily hydrolase (TIGR01509 family) n=1 Tax=Haloferula luteola TaxID=595692 RepID=A0A840V601_9BACT|nr:HAD family phosphatase [Haloferula luteola]MBB5353073.1 HAD superfamily hydrolase (TIGR01509 family) [Haloferula luteola]
MRFEAVLFDFDGIVVDTEWAIYQAWLRTFEAHGHELPLGTYVRCVGSDFETWSPKVHLEELTGKSFDWHQMDESRQVEIRRDLEAAGPMPGVVEMLEQLKDAGVRRAVVSSSSHFWVDGWLNRLGLASSFETVVCRGDAPRIKPAPDLWLEALKRLEVAPASTLAIEDSLNGVRSAKEAGLTVWAIPNRTTAGIHFSEADRVLESMEVASREM